MAVAAALLALFAPAAAEARVDLAVTKLAVAPATVSPGGTVTVTDAVKGRGAPATTVRFSLSADRERDRKDTLLAAVQKLARFRRKQVANGKVTLTVPASTRAGAYFVLACVDPAKKVRERNE